MHRNEKTGENQENEKTENARTLRNRKKQKELDTCSKQLWASLLGFAVFRFSRFSRFSLVHGFSWLLWLSWFSWFSRFSSFMFSWLSQFSRFCCLRRSCCFPISALDVSLRSGACWGGDISAGFVQVHTGATGAGIGFWRQLCHALCAVQSLVWRDWNVALYVMFVSCILTNNATYEVLHLQSSWDQLGTILWGHVCTVAATGEYEYRFETLVGKRNNVKQWSLQCMNCFVAPNRSMKTCEKHVRRFQCIGVWLLCYACSACAALDFGLVVAASTTIFVYSLDLIRIPIEKWIVASSWRDVRRTWQQHLQTLIQDWVTTVRCVMDNHEPCRFIMDRHFYVSLSPQLQRDNQ